VKGRMCRTEDVNRAVGYALKQGADDHEFGFVRLLSANAVYATQLEIASEFRRVSALRPEAVRPFVKLTLSLKNEVLSRRKWSNVLYWMLEEIGLSPQRHQYISGRHTDTSHDHNHSVINRVGVDGSVWRGDWEVFRLMKACQKVEQVFGLELSEGFWPTFSNVPRRREREGDHESVILANKRSMCQHGRMQDTVEMTRVLMFCLDQANDFPEFQKLSAQNGVSVERYKSRDGTDLGIRVKEHWADQFLGLARVTRGRLSSRVLDEKFAADRALKDRRADEAWMKADADADAERQRSDYYASREPWDEDPHVDPDPELGSEGGGFDAQRG
jgi:hypothetical protein